jgi:sugar (pentulose or hexulose) kinase
MVADVFGLPVQKLLVKEGSATGAALLAGAGVDLFDVIQQSRNWANFDAPLDPNLESQKRYGELFEVYREIYRQNKDLFQRLSSIPGKTESQPNSH